MMTPLASSKAISPQGLNKLNALWASFDEIKNALSAISDAGGDVVARQASKIEEKIDSFEPTITLIGQIKAGKTALINSMVGQTDLLPSDVNPWTSVVTSLHLNSRRRPEGTRALFRFFDEEEWDRLVTTGGRLGELAQRAGFESEKDEVRDQVLAMREKSRERLGSRFELLLGTSHNYDSFDKDLIDRYVCYGGWEDDGDTSRGRFADITKLANLYLDLEGYPTGLCLRDTPGVNDTFMMREQITINSIRDSRLCIVVLSAHQALSTMDLALLRLIANVDARDVILFVNRIDELDDPAVQIPEIEANFRSTLKKHDVPGDIEILFGSAFWAQHALNDTVEDLNQASGLSLENWVDSELCYEHILSYDTLRDLAWKLSGVPKLHRCMADRVISGPGQAMLREVTDEIRNLLTSMEMSDRELGLRRANVSKQDVGDDELKKRIEEVEAGLKNDLSNSNKFAVDDLSDRLVKSQNMFADRAVEALKSHIEAYGANEAWQYDPAGLRMMLRTAYQAFCADVGKTTTEVLEKACRQFEDIYVEQYGVKPGTVQLVPPSPARPLPPTSLGQTIALDLNVSWWKKWWQSLNGEKSAEKRYAALVIKETSSIVSELSDGMAPGFCEENELILRQFLESQREALLTVATDPPSSQPATDKSEAISTTRALIEHLAA